MPSSARSFKHKHYVIKENCFAALAKIGNETIDHVISDPPYNISSEAKQTMVGPEIVPAMFGDWDCETKEDYDKLFGNLLTELARVCKPGANCLLWLDKAYCGVGFFAAEKYGWTPRNIIAAVKTNPSRRLRKTNVKSGWEGCLWLSKGPAQEVNWDVSKKQDRNVIHYSIGHDKVSSHPTEKYESMIEPLVDMYTQKEDVVLDPFCGSGTIGVVCKKKGRYSINIDVKEEYINMVIKRLSTTASPII